MHRRMQSVHIRPTITWMNCKQTIRKKCVPKYSKLSESVELIAERLCAVCSFVLEED
jgi:hypothetical protein